MSQKPAIKLGVPWTNEEDKDLEKIWIGGAPDEELVKKFLNKHTLGSIKSRAKRMGWKRGLIKSGEEFKKKLFDCLAGGKTIQNLCDRFQLTEDEVRKFLELAPKGFHLRHYDMPNGDIKYYLAADHFNIVGKKHVWDVVYAKDGKPAVDLILPDDIGWHKEKIGGDERQREKMRVVPLADFWLGSELCDLECVRERVAWVGRERHVYCFLNGDIVYPVRNMELEGKEWERRTILMKELLSPIRHKILWAVGGCFEKKMRDKDVGPIRECCEDEDEGKEIPYFEDQLIAGIHWAGKLFSFFCVHGRVNAKDKGRAVNALDRMLEQSERHNFFVMSHVRDKAMKTESRIIQSVESFDLQRREQYVILTPPYNFYEGSREAAFSYQRPSRGTISCVLYKDGGYEGDDKPAQSSIIKEGGAK